MPCSFCLPVSVVLLVAGSGLVYLSCVTEGVRTKQIGLPVGMVLVVLGVIACVRGIIKLNRKENAGKEKHEASRIDR